MTLIRFGSVRCDANQIKSNRTLPNSFLLLSLEVLIEAEHLLVSLDADSGLGVLSHPLLEEVGLALEGDHLHPLEGVGGPVVLRAVQLGEEPVGAELDVLPHELGVHADELYGEGVADELLLDLDGVRDDVEDAGLGELVDQLAVEQAGEVAVQALVAADELVGEAEAREEAALLEPEDRAEGPREEDALDGGEGHAPLGEGGVIPLAPLQGPAGLLLDAGDGLDGVEEVVLLVRVLDVRVDEEGVGLGVDVLDGDLEAVEAPGLGALDLGGEVGGQVLVDDSVRGREEGQDVADKVALVGVEAVPVLEVVGEVDLLGRPEGGLGLLVHAPDLGVLDGEEDKAVGVLPQERLLGVAALELGPFVVADDDAGHGLPGGGVVAARVGFAVAVAGCGSQGSHRGGGGGRGDDAEHVADRHALLHRGDHGAGWLVLGGQGRHGRGEAVRVVQEGRLRGVVVDGWHGWRLRVRSAERVDA